MTAVNVRETTSVKLDKEAKKKAKDIFNKLGITMGDAFNMFLYQVNLHKGIPFEINIPNEITRNVIKEAMENKNVESFSSNELMRS